MAYRKIKKPPHRAAMHVIPSAGMWIETDGRLRLRVGKYRVVYRYGTEGQLEILHVMEIGSRVDIYKKGGR